MALETNLLNLWKLAADSVDSVSANNGSDTSISYSSPQSGYANFGGSSKITLGTAITRPSDVSLMVWVKWTSGGDDMVFCDSDGAAASDWYLRINSDGKLRWSWARTGSGDSGAWTTDNVVIADGNLHQIIVTHSSPTATPIIYVDGASKPLTGSGSGTLGVGTTTTIGTFGALGTQSYDGALRFIGLWSRSVTSGEVTTLYNGGVIPDFSGGVFTFNVTVISPLSTLNIQGLVPTLKVFLTSPLANLNIQGLIPTLRIFGWQVQDKHDATYLNQLKNSASYNNPSKNSANYTYQNKN